MWKPDRSLRKVALSTHFVRLTWCGSRLPLHVVGIVLTAACERLNVIDHVSRTRIFALPGCRTRILAFKEWAQEFGVRS